MTTKTAKNLVGATSAKKYPQKRLGVLSLGGLIEAIRLGKDLPQVDFAQKLGVSKSHLCDIEKGRKHVSPAKAVEYAHKLGYSESQFVRLALQDIVKRDGLSYKVAVEAA